MIDVLDLYLTFGAIPNTRRSIGFGLSRIHPFFRCSSWNVIVPRKYTRVLTCSRPVLYRCYEDYRERERENEKKKYVPICNNSERRDQSHGDNHNNMQIYQ